MTIYRIGLDDHIGSPAIPIVSVGDNVKRGQCIAEPDGLGSKVHSSIDGSIIDIRDHKIFIEVENLDSNEFIKLTPKDKIADMAFDAGIIGAGGAGFPAHIKLNTHIPEGYLIANCVECEPLLSHNINSIKENPERLIKGIHYAMKSTGASTGYIAIKSKHLETINKLNGYLTSKNIKDIEIRELKDMYPMGEERAIIHEIFGKWLKPNQLPAELNSVVMNSESLENLTRAIEDLKPVIDKDVTIAGHLNTGPEPNVFLQTPIGSPIDSLIKTSGGVKDRFGEIIIGGPYTGNTKSLNEAFITKTSGGAIVTMELPIYEGPLGLLVCACGGEESRLREIAKKMGSEVVGVTKCDNVVEINGKNKCITPGTCPGQVKTMLKLKGDGAKRVLIGNCNDCTNTVMASGPKMGLGVYHQTDHVFRTVNEKISRRLPVDN